MNVAKKLPDDWLSGIGYVGLLLLVGSSTYIRGRYDATSMPVEEWAGQMATQGPLWPLFTGIFGWLLIGASLVTILYTEWRRVP